MTEEEEEEGEGEGEGESYDGGSASGSWRAEERLHLRFFALPGRRWTFGSCLILRGRRRRRRRRS